MSEAKNSKSRLTVLVKWCSDGETLPEGWSTPGSYVEKRNAEIERLRAALERIDAHLEVRPGNELGDLQVSGGYGNSLSFWLALKDARRMLRTEAETATKP
jgi:hypothetical protein